MPVDPALSPLRRMLPVLQGLSLGTLAMQVAWYVVNGALSAPAERDGLVQVAVVYSLALLVTAACWVLRSRAVSRTARSRCSMVAMVASLSLVAIGSIGLGIPTLVLCLALLVLDASPRAGLIAAAVPIALGLLAHLVNGAHTASTITDVLFLTVLLAFGLALGMSWRAFQERSDLDHQLLAERDEANRRLEAAMDRLRRAADSEKELMLADERARAARDLHDGLGHRLTLISMSLEFAERTRERDAQAAWDEVITARGTAVEAMEEMRTWVRALSPVRDADATGLAAFDAIAESFRGTGLEVTVSRHGEASTVELSEDSSLLLYRAVQEGLTNALRHGRARTVAIDVTAAADTVRLRMTSDLDKAACADLPEGPLAPGFGLRGLADRAGALGGRTAARREGDAVVLVVEVPTAARSGAPTAAVPT